MVWVGRWASVLAALCVLVIAQGAWADTATPTDLTTYFKYDAMRRVTMKIGPDPDGAGTGRPRRMEKYEYNPDSQLKTKWIGFGNTIDGSDFVAQAELMVAYDYDAVGNLVWEKSALGLTQYSYDKNDQLDCTAVRMAPAGVTSQADPCSLVAGVDNAAGPDRISKNHYDAAGQLTSVERGRGGGLVQPFEEETGYTANGKVAYRRDANDNTSTYVYDRFDRLRELQFPATTLGSPNSSGTDRELYDYDANGNRTQLTKRNGQTFVFTYDKLNRQVFKDAPGSAGDVTTVYDLLGRATSISWSGSSVASTYDKAGRRTSEATAGPGGTLLVSSRYDAAGNRTRVIWGADPGDDTGVYAAYGYKSDGSLETVAGSAGLLESFTYDELGRPKTATPNNGVASAYHFDPANGLLDYIHHDGFGGGAKIWQAFGYNPAGQVVTQEQSNPNLIWTGQPSTTTSLLYNGLNQNTAVASLANGVCGAAGAGYDCNGNLLVDVDVTSNATRKFAYDAENRLVQVAKTDAQGQTTTQTLAYDPTGRLLTTTAGGVVTRFLYDGDRLVGEYNGSGNRLRRYVHGVGTDNPLVWFEGANDTNPQWLHADRQGSVVGYSLSDKSLSTYAYGPYGEAQSWAGSRFRYTGQIALPEVELYYYKARVYDARNGRFLQTDPIGYDDGLNWYAYVGNDPLNKTDSSGLGPLVPAMAGAGCAITVEIGCAPGAAVGAGLGATIEVGGVLCAALCGKVWDHFHKNEAERPSSGLPVQDGAKVERPGKTGVKDQVYGKPGGIKDANDDFDNSVDPETVQDRGDGIRTGKTSDGANITVRPNSDDGRPTVDVTRGRGKDRDTDKFRYGVKKGG